MLIRRNTKAFKTILQLFSECQDRADREMLIRLYITRAGDTIQNRISVDSIEGDSALFYEMNYQTVLNSLNSSGHQLHMSDEVPGLYFFHSTSNKDWDETPFEFDEAIKKEFGSLPELPVVRKKQKTEKFVFPQAGSPPPKKGKTPATKAVKPSKVSKIVNISPKQPDFGLKHKFDFTNLEKLIFRQAKVNKLGVLEYYNSIAEHALSYMKDRPQWVRVSDKAGMSVELTVEALFQNDADEKPDWMKTAKVSRNKEQRQLLLCNDKEDLLYLVERGCLEFSSSLSRIRNLQSPDAIVIALDSPGSELEKAVDVALAAREILTGLKLPSFPKTDGMSGLHLYIPLDSKSEFRASRDAGEYLCKLIDLKIPDMVTVKGSQDYVYGKVTLDYSLNAEGKGVIAPYSLVAGESGTVAAPLLWEEVKPGLRAADFTHETMVRRTNQLGDVFDGFFKKKINADAVLQRLEENYSFLF